MGWKLDKIESDLEPYNVWGPDLRKANRLNFGELMKVIVYGLTMSKRAAIFLGGSSGSGDQERSRSALWLNGAPEKVLVLAPFSD